jgi:hypothetical protein
MEMRHLFRSKIVLSTIVSFFILLSPLSLFSYQTENVVLVCVGGIRNTEALKDSLHQYMARTWESLVPQGVVHQNFINNVRSGMTAGTFCIVTGYADNYCFSPRHPLAPTIFEYFRKELSIERQKVWAVVGDLLNREGIDCSLHPAWGKEYGAEPCVQGDIDDRACAETAKEILQTHHPRLITVHFQEIDHWAQAYSWTKYVDAIRTIDIILHDLYSYLQEDPFYKGKTALIVTTAHGRHDDDHGGYSWHGCSCNGCRDLMFLAIGPDFRKGVEVSGPRGELWDIAPTIGELLGFDTPFSEGRILAELFSRDLCSAMTKPSLPVSSGDNAQLLSSTDFESRYPSIGASPSGIHVCWNHRMTTSENRWAVDYRLGDSGGERWEDEMSLFESSEDTQFIRPAIASGDSIGCWMVTSGYARQPYPDELAWVWSVWGRRSEEGSSWGVPFKRLNINPCIDKWIAPAVRGDDVIFHMLSSWWDMYSICILDDGKNVDDFHYIFSPPPDRYFNITLKEPSVAGNASGIHVVQTGSELHSSFVFYINRMPGEKKWSAPRNLNPMSDVYSMHPVIVTPAPVSSALHTVWADNRSGSWGIYHRSSPDDGHTWQDETRLDTGIEGAWNPEMIAYGDTLVAVWEDYRHGESEIYGRVSYDRGDEWGREIRITESPGFSCNPHMAHDSYQTSQDYLVWQDDRTGKWQIYFMVFDPSFFSVELPPIRYRMEKGGIRFMWEPLKPADWQTVSCIRTTSNSSDECRISIVSYEKGELVDPSPVSKREADYYLEFRTEAGKGLRSGPYTIRYIPPGGSGGGTILRTFPNPFNPSTVIHFHIRDEADPAPKVRLSVYDSAGRHVKTLLHSNLSPGRYAVKWNGLSSTGVPVSSGVYFCRLNVSGDISLCKLLMIK